METIVCRKCGSTERTSYGRCKPCRSETDKRSSAKYYRANKAAKLAKSAARDKASPERQRARAIAHYHRNPAELNARNKQWREANPEKEAKRQAEWKRANSDKVREARARRRALQLQATPAWANEFFISEAYHLAKLREKVCGGKWHVDHIVPMNSSLVCGLHVEYNLQVIPAGHNIKKSNRHWPDMPTCDS